MTPKTGFHSACDFKRAGIAVNIKRNKMTEWTQRQIAGPLPEKKSRALAIIVSIIIVIALTDYATGIQVSLLLFYFIPIALAVAWLGWRIATAVAIASAALRVIGDYLANEGDTLPSWNLWNALTALFIFLVLIWLLEAFFSLHRQLEQRVKDRTAALEEAAKTRRKLEAELLEVGLRERNLIGHELHDEICQHLVGTALAAQVLARRLNEKNSLLAGDAEKIISLLEEGADKTRKLAQGLLLSEIDPEKLAEKLLEIADQARGSGVACRFRQDGDIVVRDADTAVHLFRIAHEALRNALKHAAPRCIYISLLGTDLAIDLIEEDDGSGFATSPPHANRENAGMGLRIMANRAACIGASLSVGAALTGGTRIICHLPRTQASA